MGADRQPCAVPMCTNTVPVTIGGRLCRECLADLQNALYALWAGPAVHMGEREPGLIDDLVDVMARLKRSGLATGVTSRSADTPLPYHEAASDLLWTARNTLAIWCEEIATAFPDYGRPPGHLAHRARWLGSHTRGIARYPDAPTLYDEIMWLYRQVARMVDTAPTRVYLGACGSRDRGRMCRVPLYALAQHRQARCRGCGALYDVAVRRGQLLDRAQDQIAPAADIARALSTLGRPVTVDLISKWAKRGKLAVYEAQPFDPRKRHRYRLGDVVDLVLPQSSLDRVTANRLTS